LRPGLGEGLAATLIALLLAAAPGAAQRPAVVAMAFEGAAPFTPAELAAAIATAGPRCRNPVYEVLCWAGVGQERALLGAGDLEADAFRLKVYYFERGFREAEVRADTTRAKDGVEVTFRIHSGPPVRVAAVELEGAPARLSTNDLPVRVGAPFDVVSYEATRDTLLARLRNTGFARAQVLVGYTIRREDPYSAELRYQVVPGDPVRFGEIHVEGTEETTPTLVRRMLTFDEGSRYSRSALLRSQRNLYGLQIFRHAIVEADLDAAVDSLVPVRVRVAEGPMRRVRAGASANSMECGNIEGRWTSRNFLGNGRRFSVTGRLGNLFIQNCGLLVDERHTSYDDLTGVLNVDFSQPWFFGPRNTIGAGVFTERRNVPEVFVRTAAGGYLSVGRTLGRGTLLSLAYRPELTELTTHRGGDLFFCVNFVGCTFQDVAVLRDPHFLSPLTLTFTSDRTDALFTPSRGFIVQLDVEHAGAYTLSDFAYTRLLGEGSVYMGRPDGVILATRLRGGIGWAHSGGAGAGTVGLNPQKRFFAGGPNSVRGLEQYRLGPTVLGIDAVPYLVRPDDPATGAVEGAGCSAEEVNRLICDVAALAREQPERFALRPSGGEVLLEGNLELRFPLPLLRGKIRGAAFVDAGQVWRTRGDVSLGEILATPGVGVRYYSPIGPIRVDAAFDTRGPQELRVLTTRVEACAPGETGCQPVEGHDVHDAALRNTDMVAPLTRSVRFGSNLNEIDSMSDFLRRVNFQFSIGQAF